MKLNEWQDSVDYDLHNYYNQIDADDAFFEEADKEVEWLDEGLQEDLPTPVRRAFQKCKVNVNFRDTFEEDIGNSPSTYYGFTDESGVDGFGLYCSKDGTAINYSFIAFTEETVPVDNNNQECIWYDPFDIFKEYNHKDAFDETIKYSCILFNKSNPKGDIFQQKWEDFYFVPGDATVEDVLNKITGSNTIGFKTYIRENEMKLEEDSSYTTYNLKKKYKGYEGWDGTHNGKEEPWTFSNEQLIDDLVSAIRSNAERVIENYLVNSYCERYFDYDDFIHDKEDELDELTAKMVEIYRDELMHTIELAKEQGAYDYDDEE